MSTLQQFFGGAGNLFTDPNRFPKWISIGNTTTTGLNWNNQHFFGEADFWTQVNVNGLATDSNFSADTYKTLANLSGRGVCYGVFSPAISNSGDSITLRITVDGVAYTLTAIAPGTVDYRAFWGFVLPFNVFSTSSTVGSMFGNGLNASKSVHDIATSTSGNIVGLSVCQIFGAGLKFDTSLLVEVKVTSAQSGTANNERQAGVLYQMGM